MYLQIHDLEPADLARFWSKIIKAKNCWLWLGAKASNGGYGLFWLKGNLVRASRVSYLIKHGDIDRKLTIDHLCRNPVCVNPDHLEEVTNKENILRGISPIAKNSKKTHCPYGHTYYKRPDGSRGCRTCKNDWRIKNKDKINASRRESRRKERIAKNGYL